MIPSYVQILASEPKSITMNSLNNRVTLVGSLGKDPETTTFESGKVKTSFTMATNDYYRNDNGERVETTEWHRISAWGKKGELAANLLSKGKKILLEGKLTSHTYEKDGNQHTYVEVVCSDFLLLSPKTTS